MTTTTFQFKAERINLFHYENDKENEIRKKTAEHMNASKKYYLEAMKYKEAGDIDVAAQYSRKSKEELHLASEALKEEINYYNSNY